MNNEEAPLCVCGKPRSRAKHWLDQTESYFNKTCGDKDCINNRKKRKKSVTTIGKKPDLFSFSFHNDPNKICERGGCNNKVGGGKRGKQKRYCSMNCYLTESKKTKYNFGYREFNPKTLDNRRFFSEVYADFKSGATKMEIRRKYRLGSRNVDFVIECSIQNRERELMDLINKNENNLQTKS